MIVLPTSVFFSMVDEEEGTNGGGHFMGGVLGCWTWV
jgi:hypothetical protein